MHGLQQTPLPSKSGTDSEKTTSKTPSSVTTSRSQGKHSIVVVPGNQKQANAAGTGATNSATSGISTRLQQIVDSIAADQALSSSCLGKNVKSSSRLQTQVSLVQRAVTQAIKEAALIPQVKAQKPSVPGLAPATTAAAATAPAPAQKNQSSTYLGHTSTLMQIASSAVPPLRPKSVTTTSSRHEVITISDSPSPVSKPPPLLHTHPTTTTTARSHGGSTTSVSSIQVPTISSTVHKQGENPEKQKALQQAVENSRRYKDYLMKQSHARRTFQKQVEKKVALAPYPKTFRQVWPVIPVHDPAFVRNFGLEAIFLHLDPNWKAMHEKITPPSKLKPICNQCGCDFASAWQIRKSNSKQLLLCEACDFTNLKILQRSKLANQLKDLVETVKKEEERFGAECEEARKQVVALEKQTIVALQNQRPPPLTSQLPQHTAMGTLNPSLLTSRVIQATTTLQTQTSAAGAKAYDHTQGIVPVSMGTESEQSRVVIPSILPLMGSAGKLSGVEAENSRKRKEPPNPAVPPSKALKPGSMLDQTLNKLTQQLIKRKLDEHREWTRLKEHREKLQKEKEGREKGRESQEDVPLSPSFESRKNRRKGATPRHKRHLSSSSATSE